MDFEGGHTADEDVEEEEEVVGEEEARECGTRSTNCSRCDDACASADGVTQPSGSEKDTKAELPQPM